MQVGLGDISALDQDERQLYFWLMLTAAVLFGVLVGELQEVLAALNEGGCALIKS